MTGGTEVQEQGEVREQPREVSEETRRVDQATAEPEAVVEQERSVDESEAVEAAVVEAVEAAEAAEAAADGGPTTGDREEAADAAAEDGEEAAEAATEDRGQETEGAAVAATEDGGQGTEDRDQADASAMGISASSVEGEAELKVPDQDIRSIDEDPQPPPNLEADQVQATEDGRLETEGAAETAVDGGRGTEVRDGAADAATEDGGRETEVRSAGEQGGGGEGQTEDGRRETEVRDDAAESAGGISATPIEGEPELKVPDQDTRSIDEDPQPPPQLETDRVQEAGDKEEIAVSAEEISATPIEGEPELKVPDQDTRSIDEDPQPPPNLEVDQDQTSEGEPAAAEADEQSEVKDSGDKSKLESEIQEESSAADEEEGAGGELDPEETSQEEPEDSQEDESEGIKDTEKEWVPPELYVYTKQDGTQIIVDADGNEVKCPPQKMVADPSSGKIKAQYTGSGANESFEIPPWPGYGADKYYLKKTEDGSEIVDAQGKVVDEPPTSIFDPDNPYHESWDTYYQNEAGDWVKIKNYDPVKLSMYLYTAPDGTKTFLHSDGSQVKCPPPLVGDPESGYGYKNNQGEFVKVEDYSAPIKDIYLYTKTDGSKVIVDGNGDPVKHPPALISDPDSNAEAAGLSGVAGPEGKFIKLQEYQPSFRELMRRTYIYTAPDGTKTLVDENGDPVKSPPKLVPDPESNEEAVKMSGVIGPDGKYLALKEYQPPLEDIYIYTAKDGSKVIVDKNGVPVKIPPKINYNADGEGAATAQDAEGKTVEIKDYQPPVNDIYVYLAPDGSKKIVDASGNTVSCPPDIWWENAAQDAYAKGPDGKKVKIPFYKPSSS